MVEPSIREDIGTNYLKVITDFSPQDLGQLKTRIAAALEMNRNRNSKGGQSAAF